jgi:hypothetical protein
MDGVRQFLEDIQTHKRAHGNLLGLLNVLIGRKISRADGSVVSSGVTWRDVSNFLKLVRWDTESVKELGIDPESLPPRDRQRFWYSVIALAKVASPEAMAAGDKLAQDLRAAGYVIGPQPGQK